jgi:hypothetical protein
MGAYEVTMMYRVELDPADEVRIQQLEWGEDDNRDVSEVITELMSEVMADYQNTTVIGQREAVWVYLVGREEFWSEGWHLITDMPEGWEGLDEDAARYLQWKDKSSIVTVAKTTAKNTSWIWEGAEGE